MRTRPDKFAASHLSVSSERHVIVKITNGPGAVATWLFSDVDMQLTDGHVYPLLADEQVTISESVDIFTKGWESGEVEITLHNIPYRVTSSNVRIKLSDEISDLLNGTVTIYLCSGRNVAALSDCLVRWAGTIVDPPQYNKDTITIVAADNTLRKNVLLPQRTLDASDLGEAIINENVSKKYPVTYGTYTRKAAGSDDLFSGLGLSKLYKISKTGSSTFIVAGHDLYSVTQIYYNLGGPSVLIAESFTDVGYSGTYDYYRVWVISALGYDYFALNDSPPDDYDVSTLLPDNSANAHDDNSSTQASIMDNVEDNGDTLDQAGMAVWGITNYDILIGHLQHTSGDFIDKDTYPVVFVQQKNITWESTDAFSGVSDEVRFYFYYSRDGSADRSLSLDVLASGEFGSSTWVDMLTKNISNFTYPFDVPLLFAIYAHNEDSDDVIGSPGAAAADAGNSGTDNCRVAGAYSGSVSCVFTVEITYQGTSGTDYDKFKWKKDSGAWSANIDLPPASADDAQLMLDGVKVFWDTRYGHDVGDFWTIACEPLGDDAVIKVGETRLRLQVYLSTPPYDAWAEISGRMFGSWVDDGGRSNSYDEDDLIEDPAFIIESLLRDEISLTNSDIDTASFDAAANASVAARINLHSENELTLNEAIKQLAEQSTFAFYWSSSGKAKLIALNDSTPTTAVRGVHPVKVPFSWLDGEDITISKTDHIINHLTVESRYQQEYDTYRDKAVAENSTSQTANGIRKMEAKWPNVAGATVTHLTGHLITAADGIWANAHNVIEFMALGYTLADVEIGDWIEVDSATVDPHIKMFGSSFSGMQFLVVSTQFGIGGTTIKAIELY